MRLRAAVVGVGIAVGAVCGMSVPARAAVPRTGAVAQAKWTYVEFWDRQGDCIDAGQQYEREGWRYKCVNEYNDRVEWDGWDLYILE
ncbi:hypothetical protein GCM10023196_043070 [Actinoallomurus vinaceus]|uniref:Secreted protein n=1 Tax=Actinoallomurus vinaceus TaxID=1080074 RepID=A0ABP8UEJ9_9ACTN